MDGEHVVAATALHETVHSAGFRSVDLSRGDALGPFLGVTMFRMSQPTFRPHPHAGFSAVTYMLPESAGSFVNRDSRGNRSIIAPGSMHWTQAGSGVVHEEVPLAPGTECWGFQMFVDLAPEHELLPPTSFHADAVAMARVEQRGAGIRVLVGPFGDASGPIAQTAAPLTLLDVTMAPSSSFAFAPTAARTWAFCFAGSVAATSNAAPQEAPLLLASPPGLAPLHLEAGPGGARLLLASGMPRTGPKHWMGPLAMSTLDRLQAAQRAFASGAFGALQPSF